MTSSAASDTDSARKRVSGSARADRFEHGEPAAVGHVHVEQDDVRRGLADDRDRRRRVGRLADHLDPVAEFAAHARSGTWRGRRPALPEAVIDTGILILISVPLPARLSTSTVPAVPLHPVDDRPAHALAVLGDGSGSKPTPRSLTKIAASPSSTSAYNDTAVTPECFAALTSASRAAATAAASDVVRARHRRP